MVVCCHFSCLLSLRSFVVVAVVCCDCCRGGHLLLLRSFVVIAVVCCHRGCLLSWRSFVVVAVVCCRCGQHLIRPLASTGLDEVVEASAWWRCPWVWWSLAVLKESTLKLRASNETKAEEYLPVYCLYCTPFYT